MNIMKSIMVAATGLRAQSSRMRVISENIANAHSTAATPGGDPFRRKISTFKKAYDEELNANTVVAGRIIKDQSAFELKYDPSHPAADDQGYIKLSNVNELVEMADMREAQRSYEANLNVITSSRRMMSKTIDILNI
ncbi:MAG: flagellar basal body rod protein FlgC [OCS116 cluster bacterium]|uniref:Flagellar basal-body rod protein FlgC n=1 Tax=OCS116 cluster bacterium TaxID=2030921 RepID=A0A2A4Z0V2_9PROT|nr:flagellar basal body rod protein FlgC [OCS116 cluster bacterium]